MIKICFVKAVLLMRSKIPPKKLVYKSSVKRAFKVNLHISLIYHRVGYLAKARDI